MSQFTAHVDSQGCIYISVVCVCACAVVVCFRACLDAICDFSCSCVCQASVNERVLM